MICASFRLRLEIARITLLGGTSIPGNLVVDPSTTEAVVETRTTLRLRTNASTVVRGNPQQHQLLEDLLQLTKMDSDENTASSIRMLGIAVVTPSLLGGTTTKTKAFVPSLRTQVVVEIRTISSQKKSANPVVIMFRVGFLNFKNR